MQRVLATGSLKEMRLDSGFQMRSYKIQQLKEKHLPLLMDLQTIIIQNLGSPDLLQSFSYDFMKQHLAYKGFVIGVLVNDQLVAFRNIYYPDPFDKEWNLGIDIGLSGFMLHHVANLQMVCVHPSFRGNGLAKKMNAVALDLLRKKRRYHHVCATVSPYNIWNIPVLLSSGFHIVHMKEKYGGKIRYIMHQDLRKKQSFDDTTAQRVSMNDLETQKKLMAAGFYGTRLCQKRMTSKQKDATCFDMVFKYPARHPSVILDAESTSVYWNIPGKPFQNRFATS